MSVVYFNTYLFLKTNEYCTTPKFSALLLGLNVFRTDLTHSFSRPKLIGPTEFEPSRTNIISRLYCNALQSAIKHKIF